MFVCVHADLERGRGLAIDVHLQWHRERRRSGGNEGRGLSGDGILGQRALSAEKVGNAFASLRTKHQSDWHCRGVKVVRGLDLYEDSGIFAASLGGVGNDLWHRGATIATKHGGADIAVRAGIVPASQVWHAVGDLACLIPHGGGDERSGHIRGLTVRGISGGIVMNRSCRTIIYEETLRFSATFLSRAEALFREGQVYIPSRAICGGF